MPDDTPEAGLALPLALPCGQVLGNRLVKAAMSEQLAGPRGEPSAALIHLYDEWARGGAGLIVTGNVMVDAGATSEPRQVVVEDDRDIAALARWAQAAQAAGVPALMQINHAGRQVPWLLHRRAKAPSAVSLPGPLFATAVAFDEGEIRTTTHRFATTAGVAVRAGFAGVQIHAAHGYLVSQFLSPRANRRSDAWGGSAEKRRRFLAEVVSAVRAAVGPRAVVAVKLNSADGERDGMPLDESLDTIAFLQDAAVDLLELSGGNFHSAAMLGVPASRRGATLPPREGYFLDFASQARRVFRKPLMVTGGFRSANAMRSALASGAADLIGLARPFALDSDFAHAVLSAQPSDVPPALPATPRRPGARGLFGGLGEIAWYTVQLWRRGAGLPVDAGLGHHRAQRRYLGTQLAQQWRHRR